MALAELPRPQSRALAMWPPQATAMTWLELRADVVVNEIETVVVHCPVPLCALSVVIVAPRPLAETGPKNLIEPELWLPEKVPPAPPQLRSPPPAAGPKFSAGAATDWTGVADPVCWRPAL